MSGHQKQLPSVLIVEDDPWVTELLRTVLEDTCAAECAGDVPRALARLDDTPPPHLVLLDCLLPGGMCTQVLEKAGALGCAVVLISGQPAVLDAHARFGYPSLKKPFKIAQLFEAIEVALSLRA